MKRRALEIIDNLERDKVGRVMFGTGMIGFMVSGCCLDSKNWGVALLGLLLSVGVCCLGYQMTDLTEKIKWESRATKAKKQYNREVTYISWIHTTKMPR